MSTITTVISYGQELRIQVAVAHTTLSVEQVQILSGLVFAMYHSDEYYDGNTIKYTMKGDVIMDEYEQEQFVWRGDVVTYTWLDANASARNREFSVERSGGYTILSSELENHRVTFKDGMLESMGDIPAVRADESIGYICVLPVRIWFHKNKCYRLVNPDLPSDITHGRHAYCNRDGMWHRDAKVGPAICYMEDGKLEEGSEQYFINGVAIVDHDEMMRSSGCAGPVPFVPWYKVHDDNGKLIGYIKSVDLTPTECKEPIAALLRISPSELHMTEVTSDTTTANEEPLVVTESH